MRPDIPIILCTGHSETVSPETAKEVGIRQFLMKPLTKQELAEAVRRVINVSVLVKMFQKRLKTYKMLGYSTDGISLPP